MDRRNALKHMGVLGLGTSLLPASAATWNTEKKLGVALVGLGNYSTRQLAPALQETEHCYLAGIVTGTPQKAVDWAKKYNIPQKNIYNYENYDRIKDNPDIDIIYVVLPNSMHAEYTIRGFEAGKHVICEKPMAMDTKECLQMLAARDKAGKQLQIGYRLYYHPVHLAAVEVGNRSRWGKVKMMESGLGFRMGVPGSWRLDKKMGGGGAIMDLGVYCIQGIRRFVGELPVSVTAQGFNTVPEIFKGIYESVTFQMRFPSGAVSSSSTSYNANMDRFYATCEEGRLEIKPCFSAGQPPQLVASEELSVEPSKNQYQQTAQMDAFALNLKTGSQVTASGEEGLFDLQIIDAIKQSKATGRQV